MNTPRWQQLIEQPDHLDPSGIDIAIIADGGETAYRRALAQWNALRDGEHRDALAGIALVLADAFDDSRALEEIARTWPAVFPEQIAWRCAVAQPSRQVRLIFGARALAALRTWQESGNIQELPIQAARACRQLAPDDRGEVYLPLRRLVLERAHEQVIRSAGQDPKNRADADASAPKPGDSATTENSLTAETRDDTTAANGSPETDSHLPESPVSPERLPDTAELVDTAERVADDLLIAAAIACPDSPAVQRTVLSYWGEAEPLDAVPTAHPQPGELPASWTASCELIAGTQSRHLFTTLLRLIDAEQELSALELEQVVAALGRSPVAEADGRLLALAKSGDAIAGVAVRTLAARRRKLAKAAPPLLARVDALIAGMHEQGILRELPGPLARAALAKQRSEQEEPLRAAFAIADAFARPTGAELAPEWSAFMSWLEQAELPAPDPVPAAPAQRGGGLFGRFKRR